MWNKLGNILNKLGIVFVCCVVVGGVSLAFYTEFSDSNYSQCRRLTYKIGYTNKDIQQLNYDRGVYGLPELNAYQDILDILNEKYKKLECEESIW